MVGMRAALAQTSLNQAVTKVPSTEGTQAVKRRKSKRDLMLEVLEMSAKPGYIPAGFFMHFGVRGDAAVKAHLDYFHATGMDFVKIQFDEQQLKLPAEVQVKTPRDWVKMPILTEAWFEPSLYLLKSLIKEAKSEALVVQTLYSPYQMAKQAVPWKTLVEHVSEDAESVCRGMENITLSLLSFVQAASRLKTYDVLLYKAVSQLVPYNILHVCDYDGGYEEFDLRFQDYPGQVVNVPLTADHKPLTLRQAADLFKRPIMGGLDRHGILSTGSPEEVRKATLAVLKDAPAKVILSANCTVDRTIPMENVRAAITTAHEFRG